MYATQAVSDLITRRRDCESGGVRVLPSRTKKQNPADKDETLGSIVVLEDEYAGTWYVDRWTTGSSRRKEIDGSMRQKTLAVAKRKA